MAISAAIIGALGGSGKKGWAWDQTLTGWTRSGSLTLDASNGNPAPSIAAGANAYAYRQVPGFASLAGRTIELDMYANAGTSLCNFYFGCNASGAGQYFRLECRTSGGDGSGIGTTASWSSWATPTSPLISGNYNAATWYAIKIVINAAGTACDVYVGGVLAISGHSITLNGTYIGCHGDGGSGGKFDNFKIS